MGFLFFILFTIFEKNQQEYQIFNSFISSNYFKEVLAGEEENDEEDSLEQKICNKLLESETCEKEKEETPIEKDEFTEEIQEEAIKNKYLEPVEKKSLQNSGTITVKIMNYDTGEPLWHSSRHNKQQL